MSGINQNVLYSVSRIKTEFADELGNAKLGLGTGFWIEEKSTKIFVTNRHNLDPKMKFGSQTALKLTKLEIELREGDFSEEKK